MDPIRTRLVVVAWCALPLALAALCRGLAPLLPDLDVTAQIVQATLLMGARWLGVVGVVWALRVGLRFRAWRWPLVFASGYALLAGLPPLPAVAEGARAAAAAPVTVVVANVNAYTEPPAEEVLARALVELGPDVAVLLEKRAETLPGLQRVADNFDAGIPKPSHASAVFCRPELGCAAQVTPEFGSDSHKMPVALVRLPGRVCLVGIHAPPPVPINASGILPHVRRIAGQIVEGRLAEDWGPCRAGDGALVAGDLNHVPGSRPYRLLRARGLRDALFWRGVWASSWPAGGGGWPDLPVYQLDQVLVGQVEVGAIHHRRIPGADHKALVMTVEGALVP